ncbi:MAG: DUF1080 domain-containing protein [Phycisphaerae bacterium]|nr:DUF1080 domain-containing protein [Phycisphaerae bacterium]
MRGKLGVTVSLSVSMLTLSAGSCSAPRPPAPTTMARHDQATQPVAPSPATSEPPYRYVPPPARPLVLFGPDGKDLRGWRVVTDTFFEWHGKVAVKDGAITLKAGEPATGISWTGPVPKNNYEISLEAMRTGGMDFFCGLTFPVDESFCTLILGGWGGHIVGLSNVDSMSAAENETTTGMNFENGRWYHVQLRVTPKRIEVVLDNKTVIDLDPTNRHFDIWAEQEPARPLGIATWYTSAALRNIVLRAASPDP